MKNKEQREHWKRKKKSLQLNTVQNITEKEN